MSTKRAVIYALVAIIAAVVFVSNSKPRYTETKETVIEKRLRAAQAGDIVEFKDGRVGRVFIAYPGRRDASGFVEIYLQFPGMGGRMTVNPDSVQAVYLQADNNRLAWQMGADLFATQGLKPQKTANK